MRALIPSLRSRTAFTLMILCMAAALAAGCGARQPAEAVATEPPADDPQIVVMEGENTPAPEALEQPEEGVQNAGDISYESDGAAVYEYAQDGTLLISGGAMRVSVDAGMLACNIRVAEGASVHLILKNGAAFTGAFESASVQDVSLTLDAQSSWQVTQECYVGALVDEDAALTNIVSGGNMVYYDSERTENAYLNSGAFELSGGGFLSPII